jgi:hypothetical protein
MVRETIAKNPAPVTTCKLVMIGSLKVQMEVAPNVIWIINNIKSLIPLGLTLDILPLKTLVTKYTVIKVTANAPNR